MMKLYLAHEATREAPNVALILEPNGIKLEIYCPGLYIASGLCSVRTRNVEYRYLL